MYAECCRPAHAPIGYFADAIKAGAVRALLVVCVSCECDTDTLFVLTRTTRFVPMQRGDTTAPSVTFFGDTSIATDVVRIQQRIQHGVK